MRTTPPTLTILALSILALLSLILGASLSAHAAALRPRVITPMDEADLRDRIEGAWLGQMIFFNDTATTEIYTRYIWQLFPDFHQIEGTPANIYAEYEGGPIPLDELPDWDPAMINGGFTQDDLYVEIPFMEAMRDHGPHASWASLGETFAASQFPLYHANDMARKNLRAGLQPPASGHYLNGGESDDIDWQIEADFVGLMNPGQPHSAAETAFRVGHVMNYGDGVYGGVFVATMIATAFTADSLRAIVESGRDALPVGSQYRTVLDEVFTAYDRGDSYADNLAALYAKWGTVDRCAEWAGDADPLNIDAKLNGAFILLGLLYGEGDLGATMRYAMAAGQDSDCNPSNAGSILGAFYGRRALAAMDTDWLSALDESLVFQTTTYRLDELIDLNVELARSVVTMKGGSAPVDGIWQVPVAAFDDQVIFEQWPLVANDPPALEATVTVEDGRCIRVAAKATDAQGIRGYQWYFGDLNFMSGADLTHTYRQAGTYEVVIHAADETGNTAWKVFAVVVP
jgi:hypothetical protein